MRERIFVSSVQKELASERRAVADFIRNDPLLRRFFDVFLFEDLPAGDRRRQTRQKPGKPDTLIAGRKGLTKGSNGSATKGLTKGSNGPEPSGTEKDGSGAKKEPGKTRQKRGKPATAKPRAGGAAKGPRARKSARKKKGVGKR